jgi:hypothetical protein
VLQGFSGRQELEKLVRIKLDRKGEVGRFSKSQIARAGSPSSVYEAGMLGWSGVIE